jgi:tRNA threonylcarbamoyladenosine biosynthesis protein TsaB
VAAPLLLAVESATGDASVAVLRGDAVVAARRLPAERPASEALLPAILDVLEDAGATLATLDAFAVSVGPGSFTGLRVGVATVKGLAFGGAQPVAPVPTLAALASRAERPDARVVALLDARRDEVYAAFHRGAPDAPPLLGPVVLRAGALADAIAARAGDAPIVAIGDGIAVVGDALRERFGARIAFAAAPLGTPDASAVGRLGVRLLARGAVVAAEVLAPVYVRRAEAEVQRTGSAVEAPPGSRDAL